MHNTRLLPVWALLLSGVASSHAASADEITALEDRALNARLAIQSFQVQIKFTIPVNGLHCNWESTVHHREGDRIRIDFTRFYSPEQRFAGLEAETYETRKIMTPTHQFVFGTREFPGGQTEAVQVNRIPEEVARAYADAQERDIRSIGFHPSGAWMCRSIDDLLRNYGVLERTMVDDLIDGIPCKKISLNTVGGSECAIWIAPSRGYAPLRCMARIPQIEMLELTDVEVTEWNNSGIWFPSRSTFVRTLAGETVHREEAVIHVISLNEPLPTETFELAGLSIPVGRPVVAVPEGGPGQLWDGEQIVIEGSRPARAQAAPKVSSGKRWLLILNASVLAFLCVFLSLRYLQSRRHIVHDRKS